MLWSAIEALKRERQDVEVVVFSGDKGVTKEDILGKAERQFGIRIKPDDVTFVFLRCRWVLEAKLYPVLTMVGQSLGSVVLAFEGLASPLCHTTSRQPPTPAFDRLKPETD